MKSEAEGYSFGVVRASVRPFRFTYFTYFAYTCSGFSYYNSYRSNSKGADQTADAQACISLCLPLLFICNTIRCSLQEAHMVSDLIYTVYQSTVKPV